MDYELKQSLESTYPFSFFYFFFHIQSLPFTLRLSQSSHSWVGCCSFWVLLSIVEGVVWLSLLEIGLASLLFFFLSCVRTSSLAGLSSAVFLGLLGCEARIVWLWLHFYCQLRIIVH
jgi:hypothetical protein